MHWTAWPHGTARQIRELFMDRIDRHEYGSTQYAVDPNEIIEMMPPHELATQISTTRGITEWGEERIGPGRYRGYSNANWYCIGVEMCVVDLEGQYDGRTWENAAWLVAQLCMRYNRNPWRDVITHHQIVGYKDCPRWFTSHPSELERFRWDVAKAMGIEVD